MQSNSTHPAAGSTRRALRAASFCCCQRRCCYLASSFLRSSSLGPSLSHTCSFASDNSSFRLLKIPPPHKLCQALKSPQSSCHAAVKSQTCRRSYVEKETASALEMNGNPAAFYRRLGARENRCAHRRPPALYQSLSSSSSSPLLSPVPQRLKTQPSFLRQQ